MDPALKAKWVEALRSGEFEQTREQLSNGACTSFCCIGVGYHACIKPIPLNYADIAGSLEDRTATAAEALGLTLDQHLALIRMNDEEGKSFSEIATFIEANL